MENKGTPYQTRITDEQRQWIRSAADDLAMTHPQIVQLALEHLMSDDWVTVKDNLLERQKERELEALDQEIKALEAKRDELEEHRHSQVHTDRVNKELAAQAQ